MNMPAAQVRLVLERGRRASEDLEHLKALQKSGFLGRLEQQVKLNWAEQAANVRDREEAYAVMKAAYLILDAINGMSQDLVAMKGDAEKVEMDQQLAEAGISRV